MALSNLAKAWLYATSFPMLRYRQWANRLNGLSPMPDYFVDSAVGNDGNAGTLAAPFASTVPLVALSAGVLNNKRIAWRAGQSHAPMDVASFTANGLTMTAYGSGAKPFFDCTAPISGSWTQTGVSSGIWYIDLTRTANVKFFGNYFRNGTPMRKVESQAALTGTGANTVYAANEQTATVRLYMNSGADPTTDGATYRYSKFGWGVAATGNSNIIDGLWAQGNAHQDGSLNNNSPASGALGGNILRNCQLDWGSRHSALLGTGTGTSIAEYNSFNGLRNDVEAGQVISASGSPLVFYGADQRGATGVSRFNAFDDKGVASYVAGSTAQNVRSVMVAHDAHDAIGNDVMVNFSSHGNTYVNVLGAYPSPGSTNSLMNGTHTNSLDLATSPAAGATSTVSGMTGSSDRAYRASGALGTLNLSGNAITANDPGGATDFAYYMTNALTADFTVNINNDAITLSAFPTASSPNKAVAVHERGAISITNSLFTIAAGRIVGHNIGFGWRVGTNGTGSVTSSNNVWPYGVSFYLNGSSYSLSGIQGLGYEVGSTMQQPKAPTSTFVFQAAVASLDSLGWTLVSGVANTLGQNAGALAATAANRVVYKYGSALPAGDHNVLFTQGTINTQNYGIAICIVDGSNFISVSASATQYKVQSWIAQSGGAGTQIIATSGITPAPGDKVRLASAVVNAGTGQLLVTLYVNDVRIASTTVTSTVLAAATAAGVFAWANPTTDIIRAFACGPN